MASDSGEEEGMSEEDAASLKLSFSIAKPLLADLQPPIPDVSIREALWHYYFDVEKAVNYLRKERQKGVIVPLKPPGERDGPSQTSSSTSTPAMSAIQRLAASSKAAQDRSSTSTNFTTTSTSPSTTTVPGPQGKPLSKLAQLAAQRKAASTAKHDEPLQRFTADITPPSASSNQTPATSSVKAVSKLAQRIAAAKAAKASAEAEAAVSLAPPPSVPDARLQSTSNALKRPADLDLMNIDPSDTVSPLFTFPAQLERNLPADQAEKPFNLAFSSPGKAPSSFFNLLTAAPRGGEPIPGDLHKDAREKKKQRTIRGSDPFEALDPDEVVMQAREGTRLSGGAGSRK
ncbi:hypothetical protein QFC22_000947 [Naganishia vaughanmartiniae]|uniref:Uncharacterized protein n=1 Tax=Naganishia vaughanmartiniae TaxID=1424756 RepID=A0ACC2XJE9_9TREE|nr:hypothetical protein QFC22_000947 [Naganishia vaughanmartiniae]